MSPTEILIPTYVHMLKTLAGLLDKTQAQMPARAEALLSARLAPDMYPLSTQLRFAAYQSQEAIFRLKGEVIPPWLEAVAAEGRNAGEAPGSITEARTRINDAVSFLESVDGNLLDANALQPVTLMLPGNITFDMTGEQFVRDWALPQFYFHVVTAYAILRSQGVEIGKADYVPHMFAYLRHDRAQDV